MTSHMILTNLQKGTLVQCHRGSPHLEGTTNTPELRTMHILRAKPTFLFDHSHTDPAGMNAHCRAKKILSSKLDRGSFFALHCLFYSLIHPRSHHWNRRPLPSVFTRREKRRDLFQNFQGVGFTQRTETGL